MNNARRVVVIGSGHSGTAAALALLKQGVPVTMLESGQDFPGGLLVRLGGRNVFRKRPRLQEGQDIASPDSPDVVWHTSLTPGGLSNFWTGAVPRFAPPDFYEGERLHEKFRWPISYEDLAPYYEQVELLMGVSGSTSGVPGLPACHVAQPRRLPKPWQRVASRAETAGHGLVPLPMADVKPWIFTRSGTAFNSYTRLLPLLRRFPDFELRLGAHALCLEWNGASNRVTGVIYMDRATGTEQRVTGAAVIVAAGPLYSTKLLLDSACADFPQGLGDTEGVLGRYLHDHPMEWYVVEIDRPLPRLGHAAYLSRASYDASSPLLAAASMIGNSGGSPWRKALTFTPIPSTSFGITTFGSMVPEEDNRVTRHPQLKDEFGLPDISLRLRYGPEVAATMTAARQSLTAILESAGHHATIPKQVIEFRPGSSVHYAGCIRMHGSAQYGMLDAWNRLHAVNNVAVVDSSCFTTAVEKNPALTTMAIATRAAERLAADLKSSSLANQSYHSILMNINKAG